jgi:hypothetical protein
MAKEKKTTKYPIVAEKKLKTYKIYLTGSTPKV